MKRLIRIWFVLSLALVAAFGVFFASCGSDDEEVEIDNPLVGQWQECNSTGTLRNDETQYEVFHVIFRSNNTGDFWAVSKGERDYGNSFEYSCSLDDSTSGVINWKEEGKTYSYRFSINNGILNLGEIYYKRVSS